MRDPEVDVAMLYRPRYERPLIYVGGYGSARTVKTRQYPGRYPIVDMDFEFVTVKEPTIVTELQTKENGSWETWMVDEPAHWVMLEDAAKKIVGPHVCVGGLGLGLIVNVLARRKNIRTITVVERNDDIYWLLNGVMPAIRQYGMKVEYVNQDFWDLKWLPMHHWSSLFIDLWRGPIEANLPDVLAKDQQLAELLPHVPRVLFTFQRAIAARRALDEITNRNQED